VVLQKHGKEKAAQEWRNPMAREQAREKIAEHLNWYANPDYKDWVNFTDEQKNIWRARAEDILSSTYDKEGKKPMIAVLDEDQSLPKNPYPEEVFSLKLEQVKDIVPDPDQRTAISGAIGRHVYQFCQHDMLKAGWRKTL
jgi:hypothetical protein